MKKIALLAILVLIVAPGLYAASWTGWIVDEHCGGKDANAAKKGCTLKCAEGGAALVLYNSADKKTYKLDKQDEAKAHVGAEVTVTGEADGDSIKVTSIEETKPAK